MHRNFSRRDFLEFMGRGMLVASIFPNSLLTACASLEQSTFPSLTPSSADALRLASGLNYQIVATWGDKISTTESFGFNNDYLAYFPLRENDGLLCVNHEAPFPLFVSNHKSTDGKKSKKQVEQEMDATGVSIIHIRQEAPGSWKLIKDSPHNRLVNGRTRIPFSGSNKILGSNTALGTLANCAGGQTPWGTYLSCEENFHEFYGDVQYVNGKRELVYKDGFQWHEHFRQPPEHYGWVVEIEPRSGKTEKLVPLGRFAHESATVTVAKDGRAVVYSGDDAVNQFLYKFVADRPGSLRSGTLYVANLQEGRWIPLALDQQEVLQKNFHNQQEVLIHTREAARLLGATPLDRPEDVEICPRTGAVYLTLTNNVGKGNYFGSILKLEERAADPLAMEFTSSTFLAGGPETGFACPDNLAFDRKGNLWMTTDISGSAMNKDPYLPFQNNGLFYIPLEGPNAGKAQLLATAPTDAEFTGPTFSPDGRSLFLCVQHPGEQTKSLEACTSHWPAGGNSLPRPAVVVLSGPLLERLTGTG